MQQHILTQTVDFPPGSVLGLSKEQAFPRGTRLEPASRPGQYLVMESVQFKAGEEVGIEGKMDKRMQEVVVLKGRLTGGGKTVPVAVAGQPE